MSHEPTSHVVRATRCRASQRQTWRSAALVPSAAAESDTRRPVEQHATRTLQEMAEIRADMIAGVSRRPLFLMAKQRGVSCGLFVASKWDLLDAILEAEGLSPDRQDSSLSAQRRLRQLAAEAYRREAEETERRDLVERSPKPAAAQVSSPLATLHDRVAADGFTGHPGSTVGLANPQVIDRIFGRPHGCR